MDYKQIEETITRAITLTNLEDFLEQIKYAANRYIVQFIEEIYNKQIPAFYMFLGLLLFYMTLKIINSFRKVRL